MSLYICSLNSGSNGNCYYVGNDHDAVLVDAGISCRETVKRLSRSGLDIGKVRAIFVSHEHSDHIRGVEVLSRRFKLPVFITETTRLSGRLSIEPHLTGTFRASEIVAIGSLLVTPFMKQHDASDPHSFLIEHNGTVAGVFTDIGVGCRHVVSHFSRCHAAFLESNYDEKMLSEGPYPFHLKKRISGGNGHLSNTQALQLFLTYRRPDLSHLLLSHLSEENNCPKLVHDLFSKHAGDTQVVVASRYGESPVFHINHAGRSFMPYKSVATQMTLFGS